MASSLQKNKIDHLEQRVEQLEMFISTLEEQNKFMKDIVTSQNELIKFMAEQNTVNIEKISSKKDQHAQSQEQAHQQVVHVKSDDNALVDMLPSHQTVEETKTKKATIGRRVM